MQIRFVIKTSFSDDGPLWAVQRKRKSRFFSEERERVLRRSGNCAVSRNSSFRFFFLKTGSLSRQIIHPVDVRSESLGSRAVNAGSTTNAMSTMHTIPWSRNNFRIHSIRRIHSFSVFAVPFFQSCGKQLFPEPAAGQKLPLQRIKLLLQQIIFLMQKDDRHIGDGFRRTGFRQIDKPLVRNRRNR